MPNREGAFILATALGLVIASLTGCQHPIESHPLKAVVLRLDLDGQDPDLALQLKEGIAVFADPPASPDALAKAYRSAATPARYSLGPGKLWVIVSAGPLLDSPDDAQVQKATLEGRTFHIEIAHTNARLRGGGFRRNRPWRPLVQVALEPPLSAGEYQVEVSWQAVEALPDGKKLAAALLLGPVSFTVEK